MSSSEEYGLEDVCTCLDAIELQLKKLVALEKLRQKRNATPTVVAEVDSL